MTPRASIPSADHAPVAWRARHACPLPCKYPHEVQLLPDAQRSSFIHLPTLHGPALCQLQIPGDRHYSDGGGTDPTPSAEDKGATRDANTDG